MRPGAHFFQLLTQDRQLRLRGSEFLLRSLQTPKSPPTGQNASLATFWSHYRSLSAGIGVWCGATQPCMGDRRMHMGHGTRGTGAHTCVWHEACGTGHRGHGVRGKSTRMCGVSVAQGQRKTTDSYNRHSGMCCVGTITRHVSCGGHSEAQMCCVGGEAQMLGGACYWPMPALVCSSATP